jgi:hypothetical protein
MAGPKNGPQPGRRQQPTAADVPADGRRVLVKVRIRRMRCPAPGCTVQTFREQVPGVLDRYQRRTTRLTRQVSTVVRELAGSCGVNYQIRPDGRVSEVLQGSW